MTILVEEMYGVGDGVGIVAFEPVFRLSPNPDTDLAPKFIPGREGRGRSALRMDWIDVGECDVECT